MLLMKTAAFGGSDGSNYPYHPSLTPLADYRDSIHPTLQYFIAQGVKGPSS
jgi:hypothetical protein